MLECKGWILYSFFFFFGGGGFWSGGIVGCLLVCGRVRVVMIWPFTFFIRMSKNGSSFELCSIVNFILGCRFCSRLYNSLMSPHGHFQNMKQSSKYLFHDLVNSSFMSIPYFLPISSYRFYSKCAWVRVAYVGGILVPRAVPKVWIQLMILNWKELLMIISVPFMIIFLLNLGCNVSGYLSIQNEITCFPNSRGILLVTLFVTSNVTMSVLGPLVSGMEFKKSMLCLI